MTGNTWQITEPAMATIIEHIEELRTTAAERQQLIDAQAAQLIAARAQIAEWQLTGDAIMQCATGRIAPLSDSDVCGVITELRTTVEQLQAQLRERNEDVARKDAQIAETDAMMHELQDIILGLELRLHDHLIDALEPVAVNGEGQ